MQGASDVGGSEDLDAHPPSSPGSLLALFEDQRRPNCAAALRKASQTGWSKRNSRDGPLKLEHSTHVSLTRSRRARMSQGWGSGEQQGESAGSGSVHARCPGSGDNSGFSNSVDMVTPPHGAGWSSASQAAVVPPVGIAHLEDVDELNSIDAPSAMGSARSNRGSGNGAQLADWLDQRQRVHYQRMFNSAVGILCDYEAHVRECIQADELREVHDLNRRFEDILSSLFTTNSLIQVSHLLSLAGRPKSPASQRDRVSPHPQRSPVSVRKTLAPNSNAALMSSLRGNGGLGVALDGSLTQSYRSLAASARSIQVRSPHIDLSDTQQTMVVRDAGDDDDDDEDCPWESLDRDACLSRPTNIAGNVIALRSPSLGSCRDVLTQCAEEESKRQSAETRSILMTHVDSENPCTLFDISTDAGGERVVLGEGSYGRVYHATTRTTAPSQERAVKLIFLDQLEGGDWEIRDVVLNEILILSNLSHPNVVRYHGTYFRDGPQGSELWCVMECCRGRSLFDLVFPTGAPRRVFSDAEIARVSRDVLSALQYLITSGWIHRDVKLENILSDGRVPPSFKLSDFGLSRPCSINECHKSSTLEGTLEYLGPEGFNTLTGMITGIPQCTTSHRGDIYAFAIGVLIMAGVDTTRSINRPERYKVPVFDPKCFGPKRADLTQLLSPALLSFVTPCLAHAPEDRPTAEQLLSHALVQLDDGGPTAAQGFPNLCTPPQPGSEPPDGRSDRDIDDSSSPTHSAGGGASAEPDADDEDMLAKTSRGMKFEV